MSTLTEVLTNQHDRIIERLQTSSAQWSSLMHHVTRVGQSANYLSAEKLWTFLVACGYAMAGETGVRRLSELLTDSQQTTPDHPRIWFEPMPISPREREGATHIDLALGTIARRSGTESGIELVPGAYSWICFCEMKWLSDISPKVTYDPHRNQLLRVIENALCFQRSGQYAERVHVTLVTPSVLRNGPVRSRLYQYKFEEYCVDPDQIMRELRESNLQTRSRDNWSYPPSVSQRVAQLSLHWVSYDKLFDNMPQSDIGAQLRGLWSRYGTFQRRNNL